ncbi:MAG: hypothetical protein KBD64_05040, partial [Gammaproteobacteria bacterium]|nr:hypothetical protein [Gammaproteobacteria bacterium]
LQVVPSLTKFELLPKNTDIYNNLNPLCLMPDGKIWAYDADKKKILDGTAIGIMNLKLFEEQVYEAPQIY